MVRWPLRKDDDHHDKLLACGAIIVLNSGCKFYRMVFLLFGPILKRISRILNRKCFDQASLVLNFFLSISSGISHVF
ncbi:hypothetical protein Hanom_Chr07g00665251 [Helianthus anomalus]